jgi:eukaryotic-like serine/threonine-protein kinase
MATVYRARDRRLNREVAVKIIHRHLRENQEVARRFVSEARAVAKLRHPNIVEVYDVSDAGDPERYLVVELVRGPTLRKLIATHEHLPPEIAAIIGAEIAAALDHAHGLGVIHRDVKPENVLVATVTPGGADERASDGDVPLIKITDFGIAKLLDAQGVTSTGQVLGSPAHMAPEQIEGGDVSARADVFGLGVLLYEALVGRLPFDGKNPAQVLRRVLEGTFTPPDKARPTIGARLSAIVSKALAHDVNERYASAAELGDALREEVAALGFAEQRRELRSFLSDPESYIPEYQKIIVERLVAKAERARADRDVQLSAACLNRALAFRPDDAQLLSEVATLGRRERLRKNLRSAAMAVGAGVLVAGTAFVLLRPGTGSERGDSAKVPAGAASQPGKRALAASPSARGAAAPSSAVPPPRPEPPRGKRPNAPVRPVAPNETTMVQITLDGPANAQLFIDGVPQGDWFGQPKVLQVGLHKFEFVPPNTECCEGPDVREIMLKQSDKVQTVNGTIKFRPATLDMPAPVGWTASCGSLGKFGIPFQKQFDMKRPVLNGRCSLLPPEGSTEAPKELEVRLTAGGTFTVR